MRVTQPAVLVGAYDWEEKFLPKAEFEGRIKEMFAKLAGTGATGVVVYGNKVDNAALAWLTNFAPKIESGCALITPDGKVRIHGSGSPHMMVNAKRLTWTEDVRPQRDIGKHVSDWATELGLGALAFWASDAMPADLMPRITAGLEGRELRDVGSTLDPLLLKKSPVALNLIRGACGMLEKSVTTLRQSFKSGVSARAAALAAETVAYDSGAQDVRMLISMSKGGTPTAIDYPEGVKLDPLLAYIAIRHSTYWADGALTISASPSATLTKTQDALKAMIAKAKAGASVADLSAAAQEKLSGLAVHPVAQKAVNGIGLSLTEAEADRGPVTRLEEGRVYSIRAGARGGEGDAALFSAMILAKADRAEILWSSLA